MNRGTFIKNGALGVGATALAGVATQDADVAAQRITKWDRVADVVIAGAGASGLCAAIMARDQGASVLAVEQNHDIGGHAMVSGGRIELRLGMFRATTNEAGIAHVEVCGGTYDATAWKRGYEILSRSVHVAADVSIQLEVVAASDREQPYWM